MINPDLNVGVLGSHTAQLSARMAKQGDYSHARLTSMVNQRLIARNTWDNPALRSQYEAFYDNIAPVEGYINAMQHVRTYLLWYSVPPPKFLFSVIRPPEQRRIT